MVNLLVRRYTAAMFIVLVLTVAQQAQTPEFTYQGQLQNASAPANGNFDFEFLLFDSLTGGAQVGSTIPQNNIAVANGLFSVKLNFGANFTGANRFLEIRVRQTGGGAFTTLAPRQAITSAPYSIKSLSAVNADTATNATNATSATTATTATTAANFSGALSGDITGTQTNTTVGKLRGIPLDTTAPTDGQMLRYDAANNKWTPVTMPTGGTTPANYVFASSSDTSQGNITFSFTQIIQINGWTPSGGGFTAGQAGLYLVQYTAHIRTGSRACLYTTLNGTTIPGSTTCVDELTSTGGNIFSMSKSILVAVNSGDLIDMRGTAFTQSPWSTEGGATHTITIIKIQ